jgi:hypothetical protein
MENREQHGLQKTASDDPKLYLFDALVKPARKLKFFVLSFAKKSLLISQLVFEVTLTEKK